MGYNIAIDGPAGAGKSTIAREVSKELSFIYVDTGAMYRAMAYFLIQNQVAKENTDKIEEVCEKAQITIAYEKGEQLVLLNGKNVTPFLRTEEVSEMASVSSANAKVRTRLLSLQRSLAEKNDVVMDGRDIGTTILPDAQIKIYLTASADTRAKRRYEEMTAAGVACSYEEIRQDIIDRDERDMNREVSPLRQAEDAIYLDSSKMNIEEVKQCILSIVKKHREG